MSYWTCPLTVLDQVTEYCQHQYIHILKDSLTIQHHPQHIIPASQLLVNTSYIIFCFLRDQSSVWETQLSNTTEWRVQSSRRPNLKNSKRGLDPKQDLPTQILRIPLVKVGQTKSCILQKCMLIICTFSKWWTNQTSYHSIFPSLIWDTGLPWTILKCFETIQ